MRDPTRLQEGGEASEFERRLLDSVKQDRVPGALRRRMRRGLGLPAGGVVLWAIGAKAAVIAATSAGVLALGIGGGMLGARLLARPSSGPVAPILAQAPSAAAPAAAAPAAEAPSGAAALAPATTVARRASRVAGRSGSLHAEIALIDAARGALAAQAPERALGILRRYGASHPNGTFAPEAAALRIEALEQSGARREAEAQACAFVASRPGTPLAARVARLCPRDASLKRP